MSSKLQGFSHEQKSLAAYFNGDSTPVEICRQISSGIEEDRLPAYRELARRCQVSKEGQKEVGRALFSTPDWSKASHHQPLIKVVLQDLYSGNVMVRIKAAQLICRCAYLHEQNQQEIVKHSDGASVGWIHIFAMPQRYRDTVAKEDEYNTINRKNDVLQSFIRSHYKSIYEEVCSFCFSNKQNEPLSACWTYPSLGGTDIANGSLRADPKNCLIGFYLVQLHRKLKINVESVLDNVFHPIQDKASVKVMQDVQEHYDSCILEKNERGETVTSLHEFVSNLQKDESLSRFLNKDLFCYEGSMFGSTSNKPPLPDQRTSIDNSRIDNGGSSNLDAMVTWPEIKLWACTKLLQSKLVHAFGVKTLKNLHELYSTLQWRPTSSSESRLSNLEMNAWEATFVSAILAHESLPRELKAQVTQIRQGLYSDCNVEEWTHLSTKEIVTKPWLSILNLPPRNIYASNWCSFLIEWNKTCKKWHTPCIENSSSIQVLGSTQASNIDTTSLEFTTLDHIQDHLPDITKGDLVTSLLELAVNTEEKNIVGTEDLIHKLNCEVKKARQASICKVRSNNLSMPTEEELDEESHKRLRQEYISKCAHRSKSKQRNNRWHMEIENQRNALEQKLRDEEERLQRKVMVEEIMRRKQMHDKNAHCESVRMRLQDCEEAYVENSLQKLRLNEMRHKRAATSKHNLKASSANKTSNTTPSPPRKARSGSSPVSPARKQRTQSSFNRATCSPNYLRQRRIAYGQAASSLYAAELRERAPIKTNAIDEKEKRISAFTEHSITVEPTPPSPLLTQTLHKVKTVKPTGIVDVISTADATIASVKAAKIVSDSISIPAVAKPSMVHEDAVVPYWVEQEYAGLGLSERQKIQERYDLSKISHRLSLAVVKELTTLAKRERLWETFHAYAGISKKSRNIDESCGDRLQYSDFIVLAQNLGSGWSARRLIEAMKQLDPEKTGYVEWKAFYTWWTTQVEYHTFS